MNRELVSIDVQANGIYVASAKLFTDGTVIRLGSIKLLPPLNKEDLETIWELCSNEKDKLNERNH
jgi:hypothetical protein